jgi:hypothetical protein
MFRILVGLELALLEKLSRDQLIEALLERKDCLSLEFTREWLQVQHTEQLRLFLLAAKLLRALQQREDQLAER